jgi:hypothetical protein
MTYGDTAMIDSKDRKFNLSNYPLSWPQDWKRSTISQIHDGRFLRNGNMPSIMEGLRRILSELERMGIRKDDILVSSNVPTRLDGMPRSDAREPEDRGVAVYWRKNQNAPMQCMAIDIYNRVADNLCAIAATLDAMRAIQRHGGAQVQERSFRGFAALPASTSARPWREVMEFKGSDIPARDVLDFAFRALSRKRHPDVPGGSHDAMAELNQARAEALAELGQ